jgi:DNA polymerase-1
MRHIIFDEAETYKVAVLIKSASFNKQALIQNYVEPLNQLGVPSDQIIGFNLKYNEAGKAPVSFIKEYVEELLPVLKELGVTHLYCADAVYFKYLTKNGKADPCIGYIYPCKLKGYEHFNICMGVNHQALIYNPELKSKLSLSLKTLADAVSGNYQALGQGIIRNAVYPSTDYQIQQALDSLHQYAELTADIEAFGLQIDRAGIGTIAFAWDQHSGIAFACDYIATTFGGAANNEYGVKGINPTVREMLRHFFETYKGRLTWHNASFDIRSIIYTLWMRHPLDTEGLLFGLDLMCRSFDDTKIIAYLATNSTAGNKLGLKDLAHEYAGNWANSDIKDITRIPLDELLKYNLVDALSTWYVKNKYTPMMIQDKQEELYHSLMLPSLKTIIQIELTGMPLNMQRVQEVKAQLVEIEKGHLDTLFNNPVIKTLNLIVQRTAMEKANAKLKTKQHPLSKYANLQFNPNSGPQLQVLLYEQMGLPVLDLTDTKQPATGGDTLEKLVHHTNHPEYKAILTALIGLSSVSKILTAFIPAFEKAIFKHDGAYYLHGSFNLGGTVSGRLSSSKPNLQNLPAGSTFGELIKSCFQAPSGWLMVGADFNSLEDMISALTTKDPNKLKIYLDGFDGHSLRAAAYFKDELEAEGIFIDMADPDSVNQLKKTDHPFRKDSKAPTFLLTYGGTFRGMMTNLGWPEDKSKAIEKGYHSLYEVSDKWVAERIQQASIDGYVEVAFGLRVRTPLLKQTIRGMKSTPFEAEAEARTAGNALGQSYGLLNNRAVNEFMQKVWASPYRYDIKPIALIHDAIYLMVKDDEAVVHWVNQELIKAMQWQELPEIQHDQVKLGAALDIFWPSWNDKLTLPNDVSLETLKQLCDQHNPNKPS